MSILKNGRRGGEQIKKKGILITIETLKILRVNNFLYIRSHPTSSRVLPRRMTYTHAMKGNDTVNTLIGFPLLLPRSIKSYYSHFRSVATGASEGLNPRATELASSRKVRYLVS